MAKNKKPIIEIHGKVENQPYQHTLLEQIWGTDTLSRYGTLDEQEYIHRIDNMTRADLEAHARQMGVVIVENSLRLKDKLIGEFKNYLALTRKPVNQNYPQTKISEAAKKILSEGR
jgi:hypothetical protein